LAAGYSSSGTYAIATSSGNVDLYCDMTDGGWTRIFANDFSENHVGIDLTITMEPSTECYCSSGYINEGSSAHTGYGGTDGWLLGVTNCDNDGARQNQLTRTVGGGTAAYSLQLDLDQTIVPNLGPISALRHKGTSHGNNGYDHSSVGNELYTSKWLHSNGEFQSAYLDENGAWQWLARYGVASTNYDLKKTSISGTYPYFFYMYAEGGPGACSATNADGFVHSNWEIYVKVA